MRFLPVFLLCYHTLHAQSGFLKNPDIVWAAEIEQDWIVDNASLESGKDSGNVLLKLLRNSPNEACQLAELVWEAAKNERMPIFKDPSCQKPLRLQEAYSYFDTVLVVDTQTPEGRGAVVEMPVRPARVIKAWRLRQVLAYHRKKSQWSTTIEAIAPLMAVKNERDGSTVLRPIFWFRPDNKRQKLPSRHIVWAKRINSPALLLDGLKMVKVSEGFQRPMEHQVSALHNNPKIPLYTPDNHQLMTPKQRRQVTASSDTIVTFDAETQEARVAVVHNDVDPSLFRKIQLQQSWYWDARLGRLSICLDGVAAILEIRNYQGIVRYSAPQFYRRAKSK